MKPSKIEAEKAIGAKMEKVTHTFTDRDSIIYALSIGFSKDPLKTEDFKYTNEMNENFSTFPTFITCVARADPMSPLLESPHFPEFSPFSILHAEEKIELLAPLQAGVEYSNSGHISDIADKGKIALVTFKSNITSKKEGKDVPVASIQSSLVIKGLGGFGYKGNGSGSKIPDKPNRSHDITLNDESYPGQAFLYRLNGDTNPLHVNPDISSAQSFPQPILHGLASYGIVARAIVQGVLKGNHNLLRVYHVRFTGHVFPGEKYRIEIWKEATHYWFRAVVVERNKECLIGYFTLQESAKL